MFQLASELEDLVGLLLLVRILGDGLLQASVLWANEVKQNLETFLFRCWSTM